jgi:hypothetical protein
MLKIFQKKYHINSIVIIINNVCCESVVETGKVKLSLCLTNKALHHEDVWGSACVYPHILDLGTIGDECQLHDPAA